MLEDEAEITRRLAGFDQRGAERERLYRFIEAEAANFTLTMLCRVCQVSRSAYYSWRAGGHGADQATWDEALLADAIFDTWRASRRAYGSPRVSVSLAKAGWKVNENGVLLKSGIAVRVLFQRRLVGSTSATRRFVTVTEAGIPPLDHASLCRSLAAAPAPASAGQCAM